ncbi:MAG TPA: hypothetical protein PKO28_04345 [Bacilli bacterium]|nr:hypothetical protein [Bacilli bacterium]HPS19344.1 hypothetical protein [Bacilli bacterium]
MYFLRKPESVGIIPVYDENSKILMVGSITAIDGNDSGFYYASRWNSFWKLLDRVIQSKNPTGQSYDEYKRKLNDNYKGFKKGLLKLHEFEIKRKELQDAFRKQLLRDGIAICDIFRSCYFTVANTSLDQNIVKNDPKYPIVSYLDEIRAILSIANIKAVIANSRFVYDFLNTHLEKNVNLVLVDSPSPSRRKKIELKAQDWISKISKYL